MAKYYSEEFKINAVFYLKQIVKEGTIILNVKGKPIEIHNVRALLKALDIGSSSTLYRWEKQLSKKVDETEKTDFPIYTVKKKKMSEKKESKTTLKDIEGALYHLSGELMKLRVGFIKANIIRDITLEEVDEYL